MLTSTACPLFGALAKYPVTSTMQWQSSCTEGFSNKDLETTFVRGITPILQKWYVAAGVHAGSLPSGYHQQLAHRVLWSRLHDCW